MKRTILVSFIIACFSLPVSSQTGYFMKDSANFKQTLLNKPFLNTLKMYGVAVDTARRVAYINSLQTDNISVINLDLRKEIGGVTNPFGYTLVNLEVNPANGFLLVLDSKDEITTKAYLVNPLTNTTTGYYNYSSAGVGGIDFNVSSNLIYSVDGTKIKIFDGNNLNLIDSIPTGIPLGGVKYIPTSNKLIVCSRNLMSGSVVIKVINVATKTVESTHSISSSEPLGYLEIDIPRNSLYLMGKTRIVKANLTTKEIIDTYNSTLEMKKILLNHNNEDLIILSNVYYDSNGEHGDWGRLYKYSFGFHTLDSAKIGLTPNNMAIDLKGNKLVIPNMASGYVDIMNLSAFPMRDPVDVAVSLDFIALSPDKSHIYFVQRLGGSNLIKYNRETKTATEFTAGSWPSVVLVDSAINRMYVLNHFESSISVFNATTCDLLGTLTFAIDEARTDAISVMTYDKLSHKIYAAFPEYGKIIVGDGLALTSDAVISIPGYVYSGGKAIGVLQIAVSPVDNRLIVAQNDSTNRVHIYNTITNAHLATFTVNPWPNSGTSLQHDMLKYDEVLNKFWLGNVQINPTAPYTRTTIPYDDLSLIGYKNDLSVLYCLKYNLNTVKVLKLMNNPPAYTYIDETFLFETKTTALPVSYYDMTTNELFLTEFNYGYFRNYDLDSVSTVGISSPVYTVPPQIKYFPSMTSGKFNVELDKVNNGLSVQVYNTLGQLVMQQNVGKLEKFTVDLNNLSNGIYFIKLIDGNESLNSFKILKGFFH